MLGWFGRKSHSKPEKATPRAETQAQVPFALNVTVQAQQQLTAVLRGLKSLKEAEAVVQGAALPERVFSNAEGNVVQAADVLGIGQATIYRKIKRYGIKLKRRRRVPK